jgi:hypothetical protein
MFQVVPSHEWHMLLQMKGAYFHYGPKKLSAASRSQSIGAIQFSHVPGQGFPSKNPLLELLN